MLEICLMASLVSTLFLAIWVAILLNKNRELKDGKSTYEWYITSLDKDLLNVTKEKIALEEEKRAYQWTKNSYRPTLLN